MAFAHIYGQVVIHRHFRQWLSKAYQFFLQLLAQLTISYGEFCNLILSPLEDAHPLSLRLPPVKK